MKKINTAIIGLGHIGYSYDRESATKRTHFSQISNHQKFRLIAVCDTDTKKTNQLKSDIIDNIQIYNNYVLMLENNIIDLLVLAIPSCSQKKIIDYSLSKDIKNFIIEKPFLNNSVEIKEVIKQISKMQGKVYVNYPRTWDSVFLANFKKAISDKVLYINAFISGDLKGNASHLIDLIFQSFSNKDDYPTISLKYSNENNVCLRFKNKKQAFDINLIHVSSNINLFEIQIFFTSHILVLEFGGAAIYSISIHKDKFYKNFNGMKYQKLNFYFDHQKGLESLYTHTAEKFGKNDDWEQKIQSSHHIHDLF